MVPVRDGRHDEAAEILQQALHRLPPPPTGCPQRVPKLGRPYLPRPGIAFRVREVIGNPIDGLVREAAKLFRGHFLYWIKSVSVFRIKKRPRLPFIAGARSSPRVSAFRS